jgi:hypothetical protein
MSKTPKVVEAILGGPVRTIVTTFDLPKKTRPKAPKVIWVAVYCESGRAFGTPIAGVNEPYELGREAQYHRYILAPKRKAKKGKKRG